MAALENQSLDDDGEPDPHSLRCRVNNIFRKFAQHTAAAAGSKYAFGLAVLCVIVWLGFGPREDYSNTWQLIINTGTTIVTFLMVFLIQNTQNRDSKAIHLKLDELVRSVSTARNKLVNVQEMSDEELDALEKDFQRVRTEASRRQRGEQTQRDATEARAAAQQAQAVAQTAQDTAEDAQDVAETAQSTAHRAREEAAKAHTAAKAMQDRD